MLLIHSFVYIITDHYFYRNGPVVADKCDFLYPVDYNCREQFAAECVMVKIMLHSKLRTRHLVADDVNVSILYQ
jgi:hypothetical protein